LLATDVVKKNIMLYIKRNNGLRCWRKKRTEAYQAQ
jgi:hypothetical protein